MKIWKNFRSFSRDKFLKVIFQSYRLTFGALFFSLGVRCRFEPSCSEYGEEAVRKFGILKGGIMAGARICRCHPMSQGGEDPVPNYFSVLPVRK